MVQRNKTNGITLIALVITIIILLILAGVTIAMLTGENGILKQAERATTEYQYAQLEEELEIEILNIQTEKITQGQVFTREDLWELTDIGAVMDNVDIPAEGEYKDHFFEVDENYEVTIIGKVKGEKPTITGEVITEGSVEEGTSVEIKVTASINEGSITTIEAINGATLKTDTSTTEKIFEVSTNGIYYFKAKADNGRSAVVDVTVDTILDKPETPTIIVTKGEMKENGWYISDVEVKIESKEKDTKVRTVYKINGQDEIEIENGVEEITINNDGTYTIIAYSIAENGVYSKNAEVIIKRDTQAPKSFTPIDGEGNGTGQQINIQAGTEDEGSGVKEYKYYLNGTNVVTTANENYTITGLQPFVEYEFYVIAVDNIGRETKSGTIRFNTGMYLYNNGDECTVVTGGWRKIDKFQYDPSTEVAKNFSMDKYSTYIKARLDGSGTSGNTVHWGITIGTTNRIDISNYKYMNTTATASLDHYSGASAVWMTLESNEPYTVYDENAPVCYTEPITRKTVKWDISNYNDKYSPGIYLQARKTGYAEAYIYAVWLLK